MKPAQTNLQIKNKEKCNLVYDELYNLYGNVDCPLTYHSEFQLMVAVMLSAQCTDIAVNKVTPLLFGKYPTEKELSRAKLEDVENIIKPLGLYHAKAKNIIASAQYLVGTYSSNVPKEIKQLIEFPGIGRKTANVIVSHAFDLPGFAVDTHVKRLLNRIGITDTDNPEKIEFQIRDMLIPEKLGNFSLLLITHGRQCCKARKPDCSNCKINNICNFPKK